MVIEKDGVKIREVDVDTPTIYSLTFLDEYGRKWEVLVESIGWNYLIRQILVLDHEGHSITDKTLDIGAIKEVKDRIKGFTLGDSVLSWHDVMIDFKPTEFGNKYGGEIGW